MRRGAAPPDRATGGQAAVRPLPRTLAALMALAAGLAVTAQPPVTIAPPASPGTPSAAEAEPPTLPAPAPLSERLRYNARQRTSEGIRAWEEGRFGDAETALGRALALDPRGGDLDELDPLGLHNAGTAKLGDGDPAEAARLLAAAAERAAEEGAVELEVEARYNLGTARYSSGEYAAAAGAFREVLRRRPGHREAKHNLELALRRLAEQAAGGESDQPPPESREQGDQEQQDGDGEGEGEGRGERGDNERPQPQPGGSEQPPEPEEGPGAGERQPEPAPGSRSDERESRLPDFAEQPDMSAEQAGALLEAVENLERQRRRDAAERRARRTARERDW